MANGTNLIRLGLESNSYERGIKQAQKSWNDFTKAIGVNMGKFTAVAAAAGTVTAAMKVAKDAFFQNEKQLDEWGRTVESAKSLYAGFLNALNNGNISGYLSNINNIVSAARQAYDALDELGTFNAFNQVNQERARTAFTEAIADYREGTGSKEGVQAAAAALQAELRERQTREQGAYEAAIANLAAQRGIDPAIMQRIMTGSYADLQQYKSLGLSGSKTVFQSNGMFGGTSSYQVTTAANEQERIGEALRQLNDTEIQALQALGAQAQRTGTEIANLDKQVSRVLRGGSTTTGGGTSASSASTKEEYTPLAGSIDAQVAKVKELQDAFNAAGSDGIRMGLLPQLKEAEQTLERMKNQSSMWLDPSSISLPSVGLPEIKIPEIDDSQLEKQRAMIKIAEQNAEAWTSAANAIGSVGSALQAIDDPAVKVAGLVAQAIATIAQTFAASLKGTFTPWDWIAGAAAGTATMISTIAAIKQATAGSYANGGVIGGTHFSGDMQLARVNAGETILNQAQAGTLAARLQNDNALSNLHLETRIKGEDLIVALNNTGRRTLVGEFVTTNRRRGL
jgi:hypothetical protein